MSPNPDSYKLSCVMTILRFAVAFAVLGIFLEAEANGQLLRRFGGGFAEPATQQQKPANGYQGRLTAKPRPHWDLADREGSNGRRNWFRNGTARQSWRTLPPSATSQASNKPLGPQVDLAAQFRATAKLHPQQPPKKGLLGLLLPAQASSGLTMPQPKSAQSTTVSDLKNKARSETQANHASSISTSDTIANPSPKSLSLWSPITPTGRVVPASAVEPVEAQRDTSLKKVPAEVPQEAFSVLQRIKE